MGIFSAIKGLFSGKPAEQQAMPLAASAAQPSTTPTTLAVPTPQAKESTSPKPKKKTPLPYSQKGSLLTEREKKFFQTLQPIAAKYNLHVAVKPRVADFIQNDGSIYDFYRISQKHVDFLVCNSDMEPLLALELDDKTHEQAERKERDQLVDSIYKAAKLTVLHFYEYDNDLIETHIFLRLTKCDECDGYRVRRINSNDGKPFAGCSNFPKCKKSSSMSDAKRTYEQSVF